MRGRRQIPAEIKRLAGNPGKRRLAKAPKLSKSKRVAAPTHLGKHGQALWRRGMGELADLGVVRSVDLAACEAICETYDCWGKATAVVRKKGLTCELCGRPAARCRARPTTADRHSPAKRSPAKSAGLLVGAGWPVYWPGSKCSRSEP